MAVHLTQGSAVEYENILYGNMSPKMAADYLREERISIRSFSETLKRMYPHPDIIQRLKDFYRDNPVDGADGKPSSMKSSIFQKKKLFTEKSGTVLANVFNV